MPFKLNELEPTAAKLAERVVTFNVAEAVANPIPLAIPKVPLILLSHEIAGKKLPVTTLDTNNVSPPLLK